MKWIAQTQSNKGIEIFTDGACSPNPGDAGSGITIFTEGKMGTCYYGGHFQNSTNNFAEILAFYTALQCAKRLITPDQKIKIYSDSQYTLNILFDWAEKWKKNGWVKKGGEIKNLKLIQKVFDYLQPLKEHIEPCYIKAHNGSLGNEVADRLAVMARLEKVEGMQIYTKIKSAQAIKNLKF
jgi:ribonuclease HI